MFGLRIWLSQSSLKIFCQISHQVEHSISSQAIPLNMELCIEDTALFRSWAEEKRRLKRQKMKARRRGRTAEVYERKGPTSAPSVAGRNGMMAIAWYTGVITDEAKDDYIDEGYTGMPCNKCSLITAIRSRATLERRTKRNANFNHVEMKYPKWFNGIELETT